MKKGIMRLGIGILFLGLSATRMLMKSGDNKMLLLLLALYGLFSVAMGVYLIRKEKK